MREEYDFASMQGRKNPYAGRLKKQVTIRLGEDVIDYFKQMAEERRSTGSGPVYCAARSVRCACCT